MKTTMSVFVLAAAALLAQQAASPEWKNFSIGPATANRSRFGPAGLHAEGIPLKRALSLAYGLPEYRILTPGWVDSERYAIIAEPPDPKDFQPLFQKELEARFHMLAHRETREVPVFLLKQPDTPQTAPSSSAGRGMTAGTSGGLKMYGATAAGFAAALSGSILRPVIDETGMEGTFDFVLSWTPGNLASLKEAVQRQLGFQLVDDKRSIELLIVDHIEKMQ